MNEVRLRRRWRMSVCIAGIVTLLLVPFGLKGQTAVSPPPALLLGTAWYPEQWPESRWEADLTLMEQAGVRMVRVGEFAWSRMEPSEGQYDLDWLERAITAASKHGIYTVLGTPTPAPPAWLTQKYPETLRMYEDGRRAEHGNRQHFNFANPKYRELTRKIAEQMVKRFGRNPYVLGWQIDNEYAEESYDPETKAQFHQWLKVRYGTLDNLNARWTTVYWSQTYFDWSQIPIETRYGNPGLLLSWKRFVSDTWRSYQKYQLEVIRANSDPRQFITTNMMGWFDGYDHYTVSQDLDLAAWDDYVGKAHLDPAVNGAAHDLTRGFKRKNFWVMETQPGFVNWASINNSLDKGEVRAMAWHAIGHGADTVSYWQWRSALNGQEEYHGTIVGADGTPVPLFAEVEQIGKEFAKASPALAGTSVKSEVAILHSYDSRWAIQWQKHNREYDPVGEIVSYYRPLRAISQSLDIIPPTAPLSQYKLVVAPGLNVLSDEAANNLSQYVRQGGHLVLGQRSAMKNDDNGLQPERQPGPLAGLLGGRVEQFYALIDPVPVQGQFGSGQCKLWAELLSAKDRSTEVLETYGKSNGWLDGQPAAITRQVSKGRITYIGAWLDDPGMIAAAKWMTDVSGVKPALGLVPDGVEVYPRYGERGAVFILVNFSKTAQSVSLPFEMNDVLEGGSKRSVALPTYGIAVLSAPRR
ncbi:MAG: beta-galactosidase [Acidobacteria bacterium 13_1_20CM_2_60_10]|nr:MAG: beta-galactosidase [Acidobacteria bacterium 13_1_20CM_2_60_10]